MVGGQMCMNTLPPKMVLPRLDRERIGDQDCQTVPAD